jgi:hypothetical protein
LVESFGKILFLEEKIKEKPFSCSGARSIKKKIERFEKSKIETNFLKIEIRRVQGLMKNTKFIPGASKAEEKKIKGTQKKRKNHFEFFSLRQVSTKRESKGFPETKKKWMKNLESLARLLRGLF